jgi:hypothetical protein
MQLEVFIGSIDPRRRHDLLASDEPQNPPAATATATVTELGVTDGEETT